MFSSVTEPADGASKPSIYQFSSFSMGLGTVFTLQAPNKSLKHSFYILSW